MVMAIKSFNQRPPTLIDSGLDTPPQQCPREWMQFIVKECALIKMIRLNGWSLFALLWMELKNSTPTHSSTTSLCVILWHLIWCEWTNVRVVAGNLCDFTIALCHFTSSSPRFYYHLRNALGFRTRKLRYSFALLSAFLCPEVRNIKLHGELRNSSNYEGQTDSMYKLWFVGTTLLLDTMRGCFFLDVCWLRRKSHWFE